MAAPEHFVKVTPELIKALDGPTLRVVLQQRQGAGMTYRIALFRCLSCGRKTPEGLLCKAHAGEMGKHFDRVASRDRPPQERPIAPVMPRVPANRPDAA